MLQLVALSFLIFVLAMVGMAAGVIAGRGALRGSCGGLNLPDGSKIGCDACTRPCPRAAGRRRNDATGD